jgi:hypothetical protein
VQVATWVAIHLYQPDLSARHLAQNLLTLFSGYQTKTITTVEVNNLLILDTNNQI